MKESEQRKPSQKWFYQEIPCQRKRRRIQPEPLSANKKPVKNVKLVKSVKTATKSVQTKLKEKDSEVSKRLLQVEKISNLILSEVRNCLQLTQSLIIHTTLYSIKGPKNKTKGESQWLTLIFWLFYRLLQYFCNYWKTNRPIGWQTNRRTDRLTDRQG